MDKPTDIDLPENDNQPARVSDRIPVSKLDHGKLAVSHPPAVPSNILITADSHLVLQVDSSPRGIIDSHIVYHTDVETVKNLCMLSEEDQKQFPTAKEDEIKFPLKSTIEVIPNEDRNTECEVQPLKWVLAVKRSPNSDPPIRY